MPIPVVTHTQFNWHCDFPTPARPLTMSGRDLPADAVLLPNHHPWGQFTYAMQGVMRVTANHSSWIVPPQRAIWIAQDVEHAIKVVEVSSLLRELMAALEQHDQGEQSAREQLLGEMILDELPRCAGRALRVPLPKDKRLKALCDALIADPGAEHTLEDWAGQVGASERTLTRLFERELGMRFSQWRQQVRLAHAAPLIARGVPLSQVAAQLGYASQSAFSAMFKKTFGSTPTAFFAEK